MNSILAGVSGMKAHQKMIDVAGNNLANLNTTGYKASRVSFAELFSETLREASPSTATVGGTNPMQIGSGVSLGAIIKNMSQGSLENTGRDLDMALEGEGYFVLNDGNREVFTRVGSFAVDSQYYLVDPATGYRVQRIGSEGVADGFQDATGSSIRIPYDVALPAEATTHITYGGNLSADEQLVTTNRLSSTVEYTKGNTTASDDTLLAELDQASGIADGDQILITGTDRNGNPVNATFTITAASSTVGDLLAAISAAFPGSTASIVNGRIQLQDDTGGYSQTDLNLAFSGTGSLTMPGYFQVDEAGASASKKTNINIFDSQGVSHTLTATFVRTNQSNTWDLVINSVEGAAKLVDRRINGLTFQADGSYGGLSSTSETPTIQLIFPHDPTNTRTITLNFGTVGDVDGLTQFGGSSTAAPANQDGYATGWLSSLAVTREGVITGTFTNGKRRDLAAIKIATFQNPSGLESVGNNYLIPTGNSGNPVYSKALSGNAGAVRGGSLEKSNVDVASEFVNLIQAQNGFQANARTIRVANQMLEELTNLIR